MKTFLIFIILPLFFSSVCKLPVVHLNKLSNTKKVSERTVQSLKDCKDLSPTSFNIFIGYTNDVIKFKEDGKVYLQLSKNNQVFDVTDIHQHRRLSGFKKFIQLAR